MTVNIQQYGTEPIIMVTFMYDMSINDIHQFAHESHLLANSIEHNTIWRVIDFRDDMVTFADVINIMKRLDMTLKGGFHDPRFKTVFAEPHPMARLISDMLAQRQFGGLHVPVYPGLGEALLMIQDELYASSA